VNVTEKAPLQRRLEITNWIILAALLAGSLLFGSSRFSIGILCGGLISVVNFHWLYRNLLSVFSRNLHRVKAAMLIRYYARLALTALILLWIISGNHVDVIGLLVGLSIVVVSIVLTTILTMSRNCTEEVR
jgi:hypothetical protein